MTRLLFILSLTFFLSYSVAAQVKVNADNSVTGITKITVADTAKLGGNAYPVTPGTDGQVLKTNGAGVLTWTTAASQLQKITEGGFGATGYRILGRDPNYYGDIGVDAIDLSVSYSNSTTFGARGTSSFAVGTNTEASKGNSAAFGFGSVASGSESMAMGYNTIASGERANAMGLNTTAKSLAETALGMNNTDYTPSGTSTHSPEDRAFGVGIGTSSSARKDGLIVYKNSTLFLDTLTTAPTTSANRLYILNKKVHYNGAEVGGAGGGASELQKITEGGKTGWRMLGRNPAFYGDIGLEAIDLSYSDVSSTPKGATSLYAVAMGSNTAASGQYSTAMGNSSTASGTVSTAMGTSTAAQGQNSTAMGLSTIALGIASTAMGEGTYAQGGKSTAMGFSTTASGTSSTAMGELTTASGVYSTAMGRLTIATGQNSTAMGLSTIASGNHSTAMGVSTTASGERSAALGANTTAKSFAETTLGSFNTDYTPSGTLTHNIEDRAFGVGIGSSSSSKKDGLIVYKNSTLFLDTLTTAPTTSANRLYILNKKVHYNGAEVGGASQLEKITEGSNTGWRILGRNPANYGNIGVGAIDLSLSNSASTTMGATGPNSTAFGINTTSSSQSSMAMGTSTIASGPNSTAMGQLSTASGSSSTAIGQNTTASGNFSTAMGQLTTASGVTSTAMGFETKASGIASTAMGANTTAFGNYSTSMGIVTTAKSYGETVIGSYNDTLTAVNSVVWNGDDNRVFTVGAGTAAARKSVFVIEQNGSVKIGPNGSKNKNVFSATQAIGSNGSNKKTITVTHNKNFNTSQVITATVANQPGTTNADVYTVSITEIGANLFKAVIYRVDGGSWGQDPVLHYTITEQ
jgi:hypothetical protein